MKRASQYTALCVFFASMPLLFNVQIKDFQMSGKKREIADAIKKENLIGKRKYVVIKSLETVFKGKKVERIDPQYLQGRNEAILTFDNVASSFDTTLGPGSWAIWLELHFDRKDNRLIGYDLADSPGGRL